MRFWPRMSTTRRRFPIASSARALAAQTRQALVHPVFFGSAITGAGVDAADAPRSRSCCLRPNGDADGPVSGSVFKVERGPAGEKIAYVRMFSGTVRTRDRLQFGPDNEAKVTAISVFDRGAAVQRASVAAGQIGKLWGLGDIQIGDMIGSSRTTSERHYFAPPTLETVVVPRRPADKAALHAALAQLAEQDPLINLRQDDVRQEIFVSLYGEVQKEVIQANAGERLRHRRRIPRDDDDLRRAADRHRCGRRDPSQGAQSVPRNRRAAHRSGRDQFRRGIPAGGRARVDAARVPQGSRGHREGNAASGALRMAGHRLHGHHDAFRLCTAAEPLPCHL